MKLFRILCILVILSIANFSYAQNVTVGNSDNFCYAKLKTPDVYDEVSEEVLVQPASRKTIKVPAEYGTTTEQIMVQPESRKMIYVPAVYETKTEEMMVSPATKKYEYVPAVYETVSEQVMVKAATERFVPVPAVYETVMEQVEIEPATVRIETLRPEIKNVEERILIKPAHTKWVETVGDKNCLSADPKDCIVWCLVEVPDEFKMVTKKVNVGCDGSGIANSGCTKEIPVPAKYASKSKRVIKTPATTKKEVIPAQYATVSKRVIKTPAQTKEIEIPAVYKTVTKEIIKSAATTKEEVIPAVYENVTKRVLNAAEQVRIEEIPAVYKTMVKKVLREKGDMQWRRIVCPRHQTAELNIQMQEALRAAGFNPGPKDNIFGPKTYAAMVAYQKANGMWHGQLDYETANALGLTLMPEAYNSMDGTMLAMPEGVNFPGGNDVVMTSRGSEEGNTNSTNAGSSDSGGADNSSGSAASNKGGGASNSASNNDNRNASTSTMSSAEQQMIDEINVMRKNPKGYVKEVEAYIEQVKNDGMLDAAYKAEEISTAKELIAELKKLNPLPLLEPHQGLHRVGIIHGKDVQKQGMIGHKGSDGSWPWDRVKRDTELSDGNENLVAGGNTVKESLMILLVDSGIPGRGHRKTLLEPKWTQCGIYMIGEVGGIPNAWIQVFGSK